jgi:RNA polymerase primary sigma factor
MKQIKITYSVTVRTDYIEKYFQEVNKIPLLTVDEEVELGTLAFAGDREARDKLVRHNLRFVISVAKQHQGYNGARLADMINEGNDGLITAAERFDPSKGFKFISYAVWWIRQRIMHSIGETQMIRYPYNRWNINGKIIKETERFLQEYNIEPSIDQLAEILDLSEADKRNHVIFTYNSIDAPIKHDSETTFGDMMEYEQPDNDAALINESTAKELKQLMKTLSDRDRTILHLFFYQNKDLHEIGKILGYTRERIRQIKDKALRKMQRASVQTGILAEYAPQKQTIPQRKPSAKIVRIGTYTGKIAANQ